MADVEAGAVRAIDPATGIDLARVSAILASIVAGARTWLSVLAGIAFGLAVLVVVTAWAAVNSWNDGSHGNGATVTWAVVAATSCLVAGVLLWLAALGRLPWGVSLGFGIIAPLVIALDLILLAVAATQWPGWTGLPSILILVLGGVALIFGILWPAIARLVRTVCERSTPHSA